MLFEKSLLFEIKNIYLINIIVLAVQALLFAIAQKVTKKAMMISNFSLLTKKDGSRLPSLIFNYASQGNL